MSDLEEFRDHARRLSTAEHRDAPCRRTRFTRGTTLGTPTWHMSCERTDGHDRHPWTTDRFDWDCPGLCGGCMTDAERSLWRRLADEVDEHLDMQVADDALEGL